MQKLIASIILIAVAQVLYGQSPNVLPGNKSKYLYDRWTILYGNDGHSSSIGNTSRKAMHNKAMDLVASGAYSDDVYYVIEDNSEFYDEVEVKEDSIVVYGDGFQRINNQVEEVFNPIQYRKPFLNVFYESEPFLYQVNNEHFKLRVRPLLNVQVGKEKGNDNTIFQNTRGLEIRGVLDDKLYFFSNILENQAGFPTYLNERIKKYKTIPGNGLYKGYKDKILIDMVGYDYLNAQGYLGYNLTNSVAIELGHDRHFIGDGIRSLFRSDYGHNYFYLKLNAQFWKLNYQSILAEMSPISSQQNPGEKLLPKKYTATHYLTYMPNKDLEFGLFETVVFSRENHFEFQYLNPVILYRAAEQFLDSPDNILLGLSARWNVLSKFQLYGQLILDEFRSEQITKKWWANKFGTQIGLKYINAFGVNNFDLQYEYNRVRPYTYTHRDTLTGFPRQSVASYSHHNQPLAHPLGANFSEHIVEMNYRPMGKVWLKSRLYYTLVGLDKNDGISYGNDILLVSSLRPGDYEVEMYQGEKTNILGADIKLSYELVHGLNIEANYLYRRQKSENNSNTLNYFGGGISYNLTSGIRNY